MPPVSEKQQRYIFMQAHKGVPWAAKFIKDAPTMQVVKKGRKLPKVKHKYDAEKRALVKEALRNRGQ